jgi:hypothetical protein
MTKLDQEVQALGEAMTDYQEFSKKLMLFTYSAFCISIAEHYLPDAVGARWHAINTPELHGLPPFPDGAFM